MKFLIQWKYSQDRWRNSSWSSGYRQAHWAIDSLYMDTPTESWSCQQAYGVLYIEFNKLR